jgi:hypothetical protein
MRRNAPKPAEREGRARERRKMRRIGIERAFACRVGNYSGTTFSRCSMPRGTLRNADSHRAWEQMPPDCGRLWVVCALGCTR